MMTLGLPRSSRIIYLKILNHTCKVHLAMSGSKSMGSGMRIWTSLEVLLFTYHAMYHGLGLHLHRKRGDF